MMSGSFRTRRGRKGRVRKTAARLLPGEPLAISSAKALREPQVLAHLHEDEVGVAAAGGLDALAAIAGVMEDGGDVRDAGQGLGGFLLQAGVAG